MSDVFMLNMDRLRRVPNEDTVHVTRDEITVQVYAHYELDRERVDRWRRVALSLDVPLTAEPRVVVFTAEAPRGCVEVSFVDALSDTKWRVWVFVEDALTLTDSPPVLTRGPQGVTA